jgi:hypothetical protein
MRILILGINHQIQSVRIRGYSSRGEMERFEADQKKRFRELIRGLVTDRNADYIGEETEHGERSIAEDVCAEVGCGYANVELHPDQREKRGIPNDYESREDLTRQQKDGFHQQRESCMFEKTLTEAKDRGSIIVICGRHHSPALAKLFRENGHEVEEIDIKSEGWYVEDWLDHVIHL